ncbi:MAG: signal recognition particle-docking protein FtsY [Maricaulis sp.]|nr:signal recognition particle-docking protein FtsY [Maricaulis sp.]MDG2043528.1 signal recognition particle-docking protein FtsY [Maricaulis sp.]
MFGWNKKKNDKKAAEEKPEAETPEAEKPEIEASQVETPAIETAEANSASEADQALTPVEAPKPEKKQGFFSRLASGLQRTSSKLTESVAAVFTKRKLDNEALEELEDLLIAADLGASAALRVTDRLRKDRFDKEVTDLEVREALADVVAETLTPLETPLNLEGDGPRVVLFVGVNGSGKTTTLGKIAVKLKRQGRNPLLVACDTFRAAAIEQVTVWAERAQSPVVKREIGADAAGLAFDALAQAERDGQDVVLIDTAGRLQNKSELMDELRKVVRVIRKKMPEAPHEVLLVLDGTVGSNAVSQAEAFMEASDVTGVIMTKLDGTAKGGALVQVAEKFQLPIHYIGIGEGEEDLQPFSATDFARAISGVDDVEGGDAQAVDLEDQS